MTTYTLQTPESAAESARPILEKARGMVGFVPNLFAGLANAPQALEAYVALSGLYEKTSLTPKERQVVSLAASAENGCEYCVAAHSMMAKKMAGVPEDVVQALRDRKEPADARLAALAAFTLALVRDRGWVAESPALERFLAAGFSKEQALEVLLGVTQKTLSNYANHLLKTPLNSQLESERWKRA